MSEKKINISDFKNLDIWKIEADQDIFLNEYYVEIPAYIELLETNKFVIIGRKGTGKSALKQKFNVKKSNYDYFIEDFQFGTIFNASFFDELVTNYEDQNKSYIDLIKYIILIRLMLLIVDDESIDSNFRNDLNIFLKINGYKVENISSLYKTIKNDSLIKINGEIGFGVDLGIFKAKGDVKTENNIKNKIEEVDYKKILDHLIGIVFSKLNKKHNYILLIDKIDDLWTTYFEIYDNVVLNFIKAIYEINRELRKQIGYSNKSRCIIFLREDLLNRLRGKDANFNKIMQDELIKLDWQSGYGDKNSLLNELINKRIEKGLELIGKNAKEYYKPYINNVLENSILINNMRNALFRGKKEQQTFFKRIFYNRTYLRPRDIVKYFHFLSKSSDHYIFQNDYSEYLWEEIDNELYPILYDVERTKKALKKICLGNSGIFKPEKFIEVYLQQNYRNIKADDNIQLTAKETLELLYEYSVIGNFSKRKISRKNWKTGERYFENNTDIRFKYREDNKTDFDFDKECIIHAGLYQALGIQFKK